MSTRQVVLPAPFPYQAEILDDAHRFKVVDVGRQAGKTTLSALAIFYGHGPTLPNGEKLFQGALQGKIGWWIAPTYDLAAVAFRRIKAWFGEHWAKLRSSDSKSDMWVEFPGGGCLRIKSADDPEKLVGDTLDFLIIDEASKCKIGTWELSQVTLTVRHTERLRMLRPGGGWALIISTPKGKNQWFYDVWKQGQSENPDYASWILPSTISPLFSQEEFDRYKRDYKPYLFEREILARFTVADGSCFKKAWFKTTAMPANPITFLTASLPLDEDSRGTVGAAGPEGERHMVVATWRKAPGTPLVLAGLFREKVAPAEVPGIVSRIGRESGSVCLVLPHLLPFVSMANECPDFYNTRLIGAYDAPGPTDFSERAAASATAIMNGRIQFLDEPWLEVVQGELCGFPDEDEERSIVEAISLTSNVRVA